MAAVDSPFTSYSDTAPAKRVITDVISLIDPSDVPLIERLGGLDGAQSKFRFVDWPSTQVEWLEDTLPPLSSTLSTASIASTATAMTVADASLFQEGHIVKVDDQMFWISAVDISTNILTVTTLGGTAASHASTATIDIVGMARLEGDDSDDIAFTSRTVGTNYTQIFHAEVKASRSQAQIAQWGIANEFDYQASKQVPGLMRQLERHAFYSNYRGAGSATTPRVMGGFPQFITGNLVSGATLAKTQFEAAVKAAYDDGGVGPWIAPLNSTNYSKVQAFYESSAFLRVTTSETAVGLPPVQMVRTPFGDVELVLDRWARSNRIEIIDPAHAGFLTFYPFTQEPLAKTGDSEKGQVVGEFTLCVRQDSAHAALTSVS